MKIRYLIPLLFPLSLGAQSIPTAPYAVLFTSSNGNPPFTPLNDASGLGQSIPNAPYIIPLCSNTGSAPYTVCDFSGGGGGSGTVTDFLAPSASWPSWLVPTVTNGTTVPSLAVSASAIPYSALTSLSANHVLGSLTATTPSGLALPSCAGASNALIWTSGTGFGCNTISGGGVTSSIFYIASSCGGLSNCLTWVDDDATDNCGSATTSFMSAINSYAGPGEAHVYIQGSGSGKAYKLTSCNLAFTGPSGTGGVAGSINITSNATIDCAQTGGNCIQMGKTGCSTSSFYGTGCHDVTWRGGTFVGGVGLGTAVLEVEQGMFISIIDDVNFNNTGAGNATLGTCTNYSVQWDTFIGGQEFSRNKFYGTVGGQCFSKNADQTGGANTIVYTNNTISHSIAATGGACGGILHQDSSMHSTIDNNTLFGFAVVLDLYQASAATGEGGWIVTGNNLDTGACSISGGQPAAVQFGLPSNNANVGTVTFNNNNGFTSPLIAQNPGSSAVMQGWSIVGNNTTVTSSFLIGGSNTSCATFNSVPCYLGANPGYPTTASGGGAYSGFTILGAAGSSFITSITTSGSSGPATVSGGVLNVPIYSGGSAGFSIANVKHLSGVATSVTSAALPAFTSPLTNGSMIIVHQFSGSNPTYTVPTDTAGNTYQDCGPGPSDFGGGGTNTAQCFYAINTHTTASNIVTIHSASSVTFLSGVAFEVLGAAASSPIDGGSGVGFSILNLGIGGAAGLDNLTATSLTPAGNGDLIVAFFSSATGSTAGTSPNAFTLVDGGWVEASEYFQQGTSAAITATASDSTSSDPYAAIVIAIRPGGGSSGTVTSVSVTTANGVSGSVATSTTTPAITLTLGAITPSSVASSGAVSGTTGTFTGGITGGTTGGAGGNLTLPEGTAATASSGNDVCYGDSTAHAIECSYNNGSFVPLVTTSATQTLTNKTLTAPNIGAATGTSLLVTGNIDGTAPVTVTTGTAATLGGTFKSGYTVNEEATAATAVTYTLPTAAAGLQYCIANGWNGSAATTGVLTLAASASGQFIIFTDGTLSATGGNVTSGGAAADATCVIGVDSTHWQLYTQRGTWTKH